MEGPDERHLPVYRAAMKLMSLQKLCHMDAASIRHITGAVDTVMGAEQQHQDMELNTDQVSQSLTTLFDSVAPDAVAALEEISSLMFRLYDRCQTGCVSATAFQTALIALSADSLLDKYRALVSISESSCGTVSRAGLSSLLHDLSQVPAAVQEDTVFGSVEVAMRSCFNGVSTATVSQGHVLSWLQSNPRLLLWLPTMHRLLASQNITHSVRCHTCKTFPITGLRFRCVKCVNVHVCQNCFLTSRHTKKHKLHHPVLEFCTQPTWRESLSSVVHSACYALLPRRRTQRNADRRTVLTWSEPGEPQNSSLTCTDVSTQVVESVHHSPSSSRDRSQHSPSCSSSPKTLEMDKEILTQQVDPAALLKEIQNLHRDKWLLEQELQTWRLTVQSEQGLLEDRCAEMEVNMETLRQHNLRLQGLVTQALNKESDQQGADTETQPQPDNASHAGTGNTTPTSDMQEEDEEQQPTPSPTIHWDNNLHYEESVDEGCLCQPIGGEDGLQEDNPSLCKEDHTFGQMCGPEKLLQETVDTLKTVMETDRCRDRQEGERKRAELLEAAEQVGDSIHHLVDAVSSSWLSVWSGLSLSCLQV